MADRNFKLFTLTQLIELHIMVDGFIRSRSNINVNGHSKNWFLENFNIVYKLLDMAYSTLMLVHLFSISRSRSFVKVKGHTLTKLYITYIWLRKESKFKLYMCIQLIELGTLVDVRSRSKSSNNVKDHYLSNFNKWGSVIELHCFSSVLKVFDYVEISPLGHWKVNADIVNTHCDNYKTIK